MNTQKEIPHVLVGMCETERDPETVVLVPVLKICLGLL